MQDREWQVHFSHDASPFCVASGRPLFGSDAILWFSHHSGIYIYYVKTAEKVCTAEYDYDDTVYIILLKCTTCVQVICALGGSAHRYHIYIYIYIYIYMR